MTQLNRMLALAGKNPRQEALDALSQDKKRVSENYDRSIDLLKQGIPLDEGLFSSLKLALSTAANMGAAGAKKVGEKASKLAGSMKELYKDAKAKAELTALVKGLQKIIGDFDKLAGQAPTIIERDAEVKKELSIFQQIFAKTIESLSARMAVAEGVERDEKRIKQMMVEMELLEDEPMQLNEVTNEAMKQVMASGEWQEVLKRMKYISSRTQYNNGTLVFDTGMAGLTAKGEEEKGTTYLLKIYADGQVRAELKGHKNMIGPSGVLSPHYRLGKPITGKDDVEMYRKALADLVKRYEKKKARYGREKEILAKRYEEWQRAWSNSSVDVDAEEDSK